MITNDKMKAGRFERWAKARKLHSAIVGHLTQGGSVQVTTYTKSTIYGPKHATWFTADKTAVYVQAGKKSVCISLCGIRFSRLGA